MSTRTRIDLPLLLPEVPDERDECVARLQAILQSEPGILHTHVVSEGNSPKLCLHYDPSVVSLAQVNRQAHIAGARVTQEFGHAMFQIRAIDGEDAARRIEHTLLGTAGVLTASVSQAAQQARVEFDRARTSADQLAQVLSDLGYGEPAHVVRPLAQPPVATPAEPHDHDHEGGSWLSRNKELVRSLIAGLLLLTAWVARHGLGLLPAGAVAIYLLSYGFGGFDLLAHTFKSWRRGRFTFDIDLLMLLAAIGAAILGEWAEGAFLLFLFALAHALEHYALGRARGAIRALADLSPPVARVLQDGHETEVPVDEVAVNQIVVVRPGERISVDGKIRSGRSAVNQAPITGESVPVDKAPGDEVYAGTVNGEGALEVTTSRAAGDRTLDRVIRLIEEAQTHKAPTQRFTDRFERVFVPMVLIADVLLILVPPLLGGWAWSTSFYRGMALLVAASPCALALGTPAAVLAGIAQAARRGVLIKGGEHLENLGTLRAIALDKTGTLTVGRPEVTDVIPAEGASETELLTIAAAVERRSQHPLAQAVVRQAEARGLDLPDAQDLQSVTARGVRSSVAGATVEIGNLRLWENQAPVPPMIRDTVDRLQSAGRSVMVIRHGDRWLGVLGLADRPREAAVPALEKLRKLGIRPLVMLTGDNRGAGQAVGQALGVDEVRAELLPEDKVKAIRELLGIHGQVAMVGDGVNDAPALAAATVGIAMGGAGTAAALETADVALMGDDLSRFPFAVGLSRQAKSIIRQNLFVSLGVIALLVIATTTGLLRIGPAVVFHEGSTVVVILNALRLLSYGSKTQDS